MSINEDILKNKGKNEIYYDISYSDPLVSKFQGNYTEIKNYMDKNDNCSVWVLRSSIEIKCSFFFGKAVLEIHYDGSVFIDEYFNQMKDSYDNLCLKAIKEWCTLNKWKTPAPSPYLVESFPLFWKHQNDVGLIESEHILKYYK